MIRDSRRNEAYFREYIQTQKERIGRFEGVFRKLEDGQKIEACAVTLSNFYRDLFSAQYSAGEEKAILRETYRSWLSYARRLKSLPWSDAADLLSLGRLLDADPDETLALPLDDALICRLAGKQGGPETVRFPKALPFLRCLEGTDGPEDLREYLKTGWYADHRDASWYGAAEREDSTYCGYWSYVAAAVVRMKGFAPDLFREAACFPGDLL